MKGLLLKDFYMVMKYCRMFLLVILACIAATLLDRENSFFLYYPALFSGMIPVTLLSYDEKSRWNVYSGALPCSAGQLVAVKYLVGLLLVLASALLLLLTWAVRALLWGTLALPALLSWLSLILSMGLIPAAITLPFVFQFGVEKGRIAFMVIVAAACAAALTLPELSAPAEAANQAAVTPWLCLAALALYVLSWRLSVALYRRRAL